MLSPEERHDVHLAVQEELAVIEDRIEHQAGTYPYLCLVQGEPTFCHSPVGPILRYIPPHHGRLGWPTSS